MSSWFNASLKKFDVKSDKVWEKCYNEHQNRWGSIKSEKTFKSKLTKIFPNKEQKLRLLEWMDDARLAYNAAISELQGTSDKADKFGLEKKLIIAKDTQVTDEKILASMERTPKHVRSKAVFEACTAHNLSIKKKNTLNPKYAQLQKIIKDEEKKLAKLEKSYTRKTKPISEKEYLEQKQNFLGLETLKKDLEFTPKFQAKTSNLNFRTKKGQFSHIFIAHSAVKIIDNMFEVYNRYKIGKIRSKTELKIDHDFQIRWNRRLDSWHVITCEEVEPKKRSTSSSTIVIDPGIRTFLTCLTSDGEIIEFGKNWTKNPKIKERMKKMDRADALSKQSTKGKRGPEYLEIVRARKNFHLHRRKLTHMINDMHKKTAQCILENFDVVVLPKLRAGRLLKSKGGLGSTVNRQISLLAHGKFHDYLTWKAMTLGKVIVDQNEAFTTQTCFECGSLNNIGASKTYFCERCQNTCDRDVQSSFNILTRYMSSYQLSRV